MIVSLDVLAVRSLSANDGQLRLAPWAVGMPGWIGPYLAPARNLWALGVRFGAALSGNRRLCVGETVANRADLRILADGYLGPAIDEGIRGFDLILADIAGGEAPLDHPGFGGAEAFHPPFQHSAGGFQRIAGGGGWSDGPDLSGE